MPPDSTPDLDRYADALIALSEAAGVSAEVEADLLELSEFLRGQEALREFLASAHVGEEGKDRALFQVLDRRVHPLLTHYVLMLRSLGHLGHLPAIAERFFSRLSGARRQATGEIVTAVPLSPEKLAAITREVGRTLGKDVRLQPRIASGIVGGILVKVGDVIIDGTLEAQLDDIRRQLSG